MSRRRVCETQYKLSVPQERFWDRFVRNWTVICNKKLKDLHPSAHSTHTEIESLDHQMKTMKQRFVKPKYVGGYKYIAATTKVIDSEPSGLNCLIVVTAEYEKSGLELRDLEEVRLLAHYINVVAYHCRVGDARDYPKPVRLNNGTGPSNQSMP
ncbi:PREDICTED: uncharacterized protein LOC104784658 [Camelina sativa]|uniref:Uncharacterized protein LOC104784658 n=1 Tax=Camelina sativa TaxID=90675 RepID=A0ABM0YYQ6_CAMSA|nr:PREDICTED: uncharacterized protein LOC104784658 [Camelina sativa]